MKQRFKIMIDGKWQGGSFATEADAKMWAARLRKSEHQKIEVLPKGSPIAAPKK